MSYPTTNDLIKTAKAVYLACPKEVADYLSEKLLWAVFEIGRLKNELGVAEKKVADYEWDKSPDRMGK